MKSKIVLLMCALAMASMSFGDVLLANFEGDGLDYSFSFSTNPADVVTTIGTTGASLGSQALEIDTINGGWGSWIGGTGIVGTDAQAALASTGIVRLDVLPVAGWEPPANGGWPAGWGGIELFIQGDTLGWTIATTVSWLNIWDPSTQTVEWQLTPEQMAAVGAATVWFSLDFGISTGDNSLDPITGEWVNPQMGTVYIDNIRIVPEPATLAMLGLGSLSLIRRKR